MIRIIFEFPKIENSGLMDLTVFFFSDLTEVWSYTIRSTVESKSSSAFTCRYFLDLVRSTERRKLNLAVFFSDLTEV